MRRHITPHVHAFALAIVFGIGECFVERAVIQVIFEFVGEISVLNRLMLRSPRKAVVFFPLALESLAISAFCPKFGFFEEYCIDACIYDGLDVTLFEIVKIVHCGHDVGHVVSVPKGVAPHGFLSFVEMPLSVPLAGEVVLVFAPCYSGHKMRGVALLAP